MALDRLPDRSSDHLLAKRLASEAKRAAKAQTRLHSAQLKAARRRERAADKARRRLPWHSGALLVSGAYAVLEGGNVVVGAVGFVAVLGVVRGVSALAAPQPPPVAAAPVLPPVAPPPDPRSAAWPAVRRLEVVRTELARLLPLVAPPGRVAADEAWHAAGEADAALRWQAARLAAVEPHRGADEELVRPLYAGVEAQERLVAAVADLVVASADPLATARLQDATDALHGLAQGLREVRWRQA